MPAPVNITTAATPWARARGLLGRRAARAGEALHLPRTRSVHTFGMRFALDLVWLDRDGCVVRLDEGVRPWRLRTCLRARSVVECGAGEGRRLARVLS